MRCTTALERLLAQLPFFPGASPSTWSAGRCAAAWVTHPAERTGGVSYAAVDGGRLSLFAGRPFRWTGDDVADGWGPLDARSYLEPAGAWFDALDGRFAAVRCDGGGVEVACDVLGAYPLYVSDGDGARWISNNPELCRVAAGLPRRPSEAVLASVVGGGWSLTGDPLWVGVRRLAPGAHAFGERERSPSPWPLPAAGGGLDADAAAARLRAATGALADWPGRPSVVPVTGGRDSRLVLAAAVSAGLEVSTTTGGEPDARDVGVGRELAGALGVEHSLIAGDPGGALPPDWRRAAELLALTAAGTATLADAAGFPFGAREGPLPLWHSGQGGEIARSYYGAGSGSADELAERLYRAFVARRPGRSGLLSAGGADSVHGDIAAWVRDRLEAGARPEDVPDLFYLERRMGTWAGPTHGCVEYVRDTTSPLWGRRLVADELSLPARERARERFHALLLRRLAPELLSIPYEDGARPGGESELALRWRRARRLAAKAGEEARRRLAGRRSGGVVAAADPFEAVRPEIQEAVLGLPQAAAWEVLDRPRVERLLATPAAALDTMSRYYVWRLATVFSLEAGAGAE